MKKLEDEIRDLADLDALRKKSAVLRDGGRKALLIADERSWNPARVSFEDALIIKALCDHKEGPPALLVSKLETMPAEEVFDDSTPVPILRAARSMQALAAAPSSAFSESLLIFYYQIIREIYSADEPDWRVGGARAGARGAASAYVTGECVRAILGFARTLESTGLFVGEAGSILKRRKQLLHKEMPEPWRATEMSRLELDLCTTYKRYSDNLAFDLRPLVERGWDAATFLKNVRLEIGRVVAEALETFRGAEDKIKEYRDEEFKRARKRPAKTRFERSETGHAVALGAIKQAVKTAENAAQLFSDAEPDLHNLASMFSKSGQSVRALIRPAKMFLSSVLDRELAAASSDANPERDPGELAFAAASYGFSAGDWSDDRLLRAGNCLSRLLSERGHFPVGQPFHVDSKGSHFDVVGAEVLRAFAQLLEKVEDVPVDRSLVSRMLNFFEDTKKNIPVMPPMYGWNLGALQPTSRPIRWGTAVAVLALDHINRMLDERINIQVFRHFYVRKPDELKDLDLRKLFYPDHGLRRAGNPWREEPVAISLEHIRSHVIGVPPLEKRMEPLFSLALFGPPGTGKTTLVEALAKSCHVPLVEITPSDLVSEGADAVERRARAVFKALSLLTGAVIMFDEFDPVLKRRDPDDPRPSSVFSFLTPGMLPKLKDLHDNARRRRVAYVLITNLIDTLDEAAIRAGRFDLKAGIYPPDPLSRAGRIIDQLIAFRQREGEVEEELPIDRIRDVVRETKGAPMETLARKGWFLPPASKDEIPKGSPFEYLCGRSSQFNPLLEREADFEKECGKSKMSPKEHQQWGWVHQWDTAEGWNNKSLKDLLESAPGAPPEPPPKSGAPLAFITWGTETPPQGTKFVVLYGIQQDGNGQHAAPSTDPASLGSTPGKEGPPKKKGDSGSTSRRV